MVAQATDMSSSEEEIDDTYSFTECRSDFEYEGKAGYTCEAEYFKEDLAQIFLFSFCGLVVDFFTYSFSVFLLSWTFTSQKLKIINYSSVVHCIFYFISMVCLLIIEIMLIGS